MINCKCDFCGKDIASGYEISCKPFAIDENINVADLLGECGIWHMCRDCMNNLGKVSQAMEEEIKRGKMLKKMYCTYSKRK